MKTKFRSQIKYYLFGILLVLAFSNCQQVTPGYLEDTSAAIKKEIDTNPGSPRLSAAFTQIPKSISNSGEAVFGLKGDKDGNPLYTFECMTDSKTFEDCQSQFSLTGLYEGKHDFKFRAKDDTGLVSEVQVYSWLVDLNGPEINIVSAPGTIKQGDRAVINFTVTDALSGIASVKCGLTDLTECQHESNVDLGTLPVGTHTFTIKATDVAGTEATKSATFQVTAKNIICDPFVIGADTACKGGLIGEIYYLNSSQQAAFQALGTKTVDYFYSNGTIVNAILNLNQLFVTTRSFSSGFPTNGGQLIVDNSGNVLTDYFAFKLKTVLKLDTASDQAGWYQLATLSDDGTVISITPSPGASSQVLINNDGDHSTRMGCSSGAIYLDANSRIAMEIKYYQGPRTEIALTMMWKKVSAANSAPDSMCGVAGSNSFFGPSPYTDMTGSGFGTLINRGWKVIAPANFIAPL
jgi:hypothetical protein